MQLDDRKLGRKQRVEQRNGRMGIGTGIYNDAGRLVARLLDPVDQCAFAIALPEVDLQPQRFGMCDG